MARTIYVERPPRDDLRLGRVIVHDSESRRYAYRPWSGFALRSVKHERHVPIFDQGQLGSCTGNAALGCLGTGEFYATVKDQVRFDEAGAVLIYSDGTRNDEFPGEYPPDDTGSSGLGVAKACQALRLVTGYEHALGIDPALAAAADRPVITGFNWYSSFDNPEANGFVTLPRTARVLGGHEVVVDEVNVDNESIGLTNSWGNWGPKNGRFFMRFATWERLLNEQGDVTVFTPLTMPAPTPTPVAAVTDADLWAAARSWAAGKNFI